MIFKIEFYFKISRFQVVYSPESWSMICPFLYRILRVTSYNLEKTNNKFLIKNNNLTTFSLQKLFSKTMYLL